MKRGEFTKSGTIYSRSREGAGSTRKIHQLLRRRSRAPTRNLKEAERRATEARKAKRAKRDDQFVT